jgi:hypothetical protein
MAHAAQADPDPPDPPDPTAAGATDDLQARLDAAHRAAAAADLRVVSPINSPAPAAKAGLLPPGAGELL